MRGRLYRKSDNLVVADPCQVADTFFSRFKGLMGDKALESGSGLLIEPCNSIHTFFMRFDIDVVYLAAASGDARRDFRIMAVRRSMRPWRIDLPVFGARAVLELPSGAAKALTEGDHLCLS